MERCGKKLLTMRHGRPPQATPAKTEVAQQVSCSSWKFAPGAEMLADAGQGLADVGQNWLSFGRHRPTSADMGDCLADLGRIWPELGQFQPSADPLGAPF